MKKCSNKIFDTRQEINESTLLISATFYTQNRWINLFNSIFIGKLIGLSNLLPVNSYISLKLEFENIYDEKINIIPNVPIKVIYPESGSGVQQYRPWKINLPELQRKNDKCFAKIDKLFMPELSGTHHLIIEQSKEVNLKYAGRHGLTERTYKQMTDSWIGTFHVSSEMEYRPYVISIIALIVSFMALISSLFVDAFDY